MNNQTYYIAFGDSAAECIKSSIIKHGLEPYPIVVTRDDLTQGPIESNLDFNKQRIDYWNSVFYYLGHDQDVEQQYLDTIDKLSMLNENSAVMWIGDSCHDILMAGWLLNEFPETTWFYIPLAQHSNLISPLPPVNLAMFTPLQISMLSKSKMSLNHKTQDDLKRKWINAQIDSGAYRINDMGQLKNVNENHYDQFIQQFIGTDFTPARSVISDAINASKHTITDLIVEFRIRKMIDQKTILVKGDLSHWSKYFLRKP